MVNIDMKEKEEWNSILVPGMKGNGRMEKCMGKDYTPGLTPYNMKAITIMDPNMEREKSLKVKTYMRWASGWKAKEREYLKNIKMICLCSRKISIIVVDK